jgi:hypothetical protein
VKSRHPIKGQKATFREEGLSGFGESFKVVPREVLVRANCSRQLPSGIC